MKRCIAFSLGFAFLAALVAARPALAQSLPDTLEAIDRARVTTRILFITAHPDDEWPGLLAYLSRGRAADVALLTITRGQGGQNAIGPEQGDEMGMLRTHELLAADKIYGVQHQFFTRAPDFGYSKSADQTLKIWGAVPVEDMVRVIRMFRPDIVINGWGGVHGGHGQHQASGILTPQAIAQAADPRAFPQQIAQGLAPWKTPLALEPVFGDSPEGLRIPTDEISPLWGKSYIEIGIEGRAQHRSQGTPGASGSPFFRRPTYLKSAGGEKVDPDVESSHLADLAERAPAIHDEVVDADLSLLAARGAALQLDWPDAAKALAKAGQDIESAQKTLAHPSDAAEEGVLYDLLCARGRIDAALAQVLDLRIEAHADRSELVAGETFSVHLESIERPGIGSETAKPSLVLPSGWTVTKQEPDENGVRVTVAIPAGAVTPHSPQDAVLPWPPPLVQAECRATVEGYEFAVKVPVVSVQFTSTEVVTYPLALVPALSLTVEPQQVMLPAKNASRPVELLARVRYHATAPADVTAGLDVPAGWRVDPVAPLHFTAAGDQLVRFVVTPPSQSAAGAYPLKPFAKRGNEAFRESVEPLPSLPTRLWTEPADATAHVLDLAVPEKLRVGYISAGIDPLPELLRQLGIQVDMLDEVALAFGDLRRYRAIVVGIRAYELRGDVVRSNPRLLDYVSAGGTLVVQYQRDFVWNRYKLAPYPAAMPQQTSRTTDENSPVRLLAPESPLLNFPNKVTLDDFKGWVQERGLYYWGTFDSRYQPILAFRDPGEEEAKGALVVAPVGKGTYIYTGISFFRQLPAGVPGAYRLFVNLLSQSK
ncbi:MAG TPA: PIG-L family deacetylase [Candidatus Acidoferrales bacterium]|nr:PIG-L family deacetylase [Candidatus Acidoferrales bacterium]